MNKKFITVIITDQPDAIEIVAKKKGMIAAEEIEIINNPNEQTLMRRTLPSFLDWLKYQIQNV